MRFIRTALAVCFVLLAATAAAAQSGGITVVVTDAEGTPLPGALVTISHETGSVKTTTDQTDKKGIVDFPVLRAGAGYSIEVSFPAGGFATVRQDNVRVMISETVTLPVTLMDEFQERVKVTAERDVIDLDKTESSTRFSDAFIADLPVPGRFYQNVLTMAPGVQDPDGDGNPTVHGSRDRDFQAVVSGVSNVDPLTGQWMSRINPNSIEEMEVITAGAGVEFGRAQGGFARIIQKQGSNTHEGVFEFYWQTSKLDGDGSSDQSALPDATFDTIQPLFQFSGPIAKDKLWYRVSYERRDLEEPINVLSGVAVHTRDTATEDAQITWQTSPRNKLALNYRADPVDETNLGVSSVRPPESSIAFGRDVETWSINWTAPYSPKVLVESTFGWQDINNRFGPTGGGDGRNACVPNANEIFLQEALCNDLTLNQLSGPYNANSSDQRQRMTVKGQATVYGGRFWGMSHQYKVGINIENERYFRDLSVDPFVNFIVVTDSTQQDPDNPDEEPNLEVFGLALARLSVPQSDEIRATGTNWAIYAEDQFKPAQNLTITLGGRLSREEINSEGRLPFDPAAELAAYEAHVDANPISGVDDWDQFFTGYEDYESFKTQMESILCSGVPADEVGNCQTIVSQNILSQTQDDLDRVRRSANIDVTNTNFQPFLSVAWSPWANGKTAFKASAGRYYNNVPLIVPTRELEPVLTDIDYSVSLVDPAACEAQQVENPDSEIPCGGTKLRGGIEPKINVQTVDRSLKTPYQDEFSFKVERELWAETSISFQYIKRKYEDQLQDININLATADYGKCRKQNSAANPGLPVIESPGTGLITDDYGNVYMDTDPGPGDGLLDDCAGETEFLIPPAGDSGEICSGDPFCDGAARVQRPDGITDLYLQNPFWGDIFLIGNFNSAEYDGYVLELVRRQYRSWEMNASYTYSEAIGDGEDFEQILGDDPSLRDNVRGFQSSDQRHVVKLNATTITPWGIRLGSSISWQSGLPFSLLTQQFSVDQLAPSTTPFVGPGSRARQTYNTGVRNDQRNDSYWNVDLKATKELRLAKGLNMQVSAEVFNLLDDDTYKVYNNGLKRGVQVNGVNEAFREFGRRWQVGMKIAF